MTMTIEEKIKALMSGRRFKCDGAEFYYDQKGNIPFVLKQDYGSIDHINGYWEIDWEEIIEKPWQPVHGEKVLCRDSADRKWRCTFFSHEIEGDMFAIGGACWKFIAPFDIEKLGKV